MTKTNKFLISLTSSLLVFFILIIPAVSVAQGGNPQSSPGLVPCGKAGGPACGFSDIMVLIDRVIKFILYDLVVPIAAIMFAYAGFLLITAGGGEAKTNAKNIFTNAVIGLIISVAAFLIIKTILSILGYKDAAWIGF